MGDPLYIDISIYDNLEWSRTIGNILESYISIYNNAVHTVYGVYCTVCSLYYELLTLGCGFVLYDVCCVMCGVMCGV